MLMLCYAMLCYVMWMFVNVNVGVNVIVNVDGLLCYIMLYYVTLCYVMLCFVMLRICNVCEYACMLAYMYACIYAPS